MSEESCFEVIFQGSLARCLPEPGEVGQVVLVSGKLFQFDGDEWIKLETPCKFIFHDICSKKTFLVRAHRKCFIKPICLEGLVFDCIDQTFFRVKDECWQKLCTLCDTQTLVRCTQVPGDLPPNTTLDAFPIEFLSMNPKVRPESQIQEICVTESTVNLTGLEPGDCLVLIYEFPNPQNPHCVTLVNHIFKRGQPLAELATTLSFPLSAIDPIPPSGVPINGNWVNTTSVENTASSNFVNGIYTVPIEGLYEVQVYLNYEREEFTIDQVDNTGQLIGMASGMTVMFPFTFTQNPRLELNHTPDGGPKSVIKEGWFPQTNVYMLTGGTGQLSLFVEPLKRGQIVINALLNLEEGDSLHLEFEDIYFGVNNGEITWTVHRLGEINEP